MPIAKALRQVGLPAFIADAVESRFVGTVEPPQKPRRSANEEKVRRLLRRLQKVRHDEYLALPESVGRDTFVEACRRMMVPSDREVLVAGLGCRMGTNRGRPSRVTHAWVGAGTKGAVSFTPLGTALVRAQCSTVDRGEVLLIHNHPPSLRRLVLTELLGGQPLPTLVDRTTAGRRHADSLREFLTFHHDGFYRLYLVDQGVASEFILPPLDVILDKLSWLVRAPEQAFVEWLMGVSRQAPW